jgi:Protein of unknown function (DUF551)
MTTPSLDAALRSLKRAVDEVARNMLYPKGQRPLGWSDLIAAVDNLEALLRQAQPIPLEESCPHCHLPRVLPEVCTPELNAVIEANIARDWDLYGAGYTAGKRQAQPIPYWQPIETAPKDGTVVLLWEDDMVTVGSYTNFDSVGGAPEGYHNGWFDDETGYHEIIPSHWMPLPDPPTEIPR